MTLRNFRHEFGLLFFISALFIGCNPAPSTQPQALIGIADEPRRLEDWFSVHFDPEVPSIQKILFAQDLSWILATKFKGDENDYFRVAFSGNSGEAIVSYLDTRVNYILPADIEIESRISEKTLELQKSKGQIAAVNIGAAIFVHSLVNKTELDVDVGGQTVRVESTRVGIIQLGKGYRTQSYNVNRTATLVHEGRHSDCTGGYDYEDETRAKRCGHLHAECPEDHDLAGLPACDTEIWGAYAIEYLYSKRMSQCDGCRTDEIDAAESSALDSLSRVQPASEIIDRLAPLPDMTSSPN